MTTHQPKSPGRNSHQIDEIYLAAVTKAGFGHVTPRTENYRDATTDVAHGSRRSEHRGREGDDGIIVGSNHNYHSRQPQHPKQQRQSTVCQTTPRSVMNIGSKSVAIGVPRDNANSALCVRFGHVDINQDFGSGSHKESGYHSVDSDDGGFLNRTTAKVAFTRTSNVSQNTQSGDSTSTTISTGAASGSLLMQAESEMECYFVEERRGNMHEALMHINKAIYLYHQVLVANEHTSTGVVQQDQVRLRIIYNGAMLKLRRLVHQMTTSHPFGGTSGSAGSKIQPPHRQPDVVCRIVDTTATNNPRSSSRLLNSWYGDNAYVIAADGSRLNMDTVVNGDDEYRSVQTYATLPKKSNVMRGTRDVLPQLPHVNRYRDVSADRLIGRWTNDSTMSPRSPSTSYRQFNSLPRPSTNRQPITSVHGRHLL